ncbi:SMP-30/gluconolactonase/LRE family protein [Humibacter sp. RRB41]|uniref:SMP-30/gluconolactonase/LRE family protein n=1 Tax=Humibacter sp. RRB41 TaxID=2919946 RepID=UPI001FAAE19D|nr:SMP-30/gluconolactonase/LRE family protein [Humibacter sp. RRB41]
MKAEQITERVAEHGEGPVWDGAGGRLLIVDMLAGEVLDLGDPTAAGAAGEPVTAVRHAVGSPVAAALRPRASGGFVVATEHGFSLFSDPFELERTVPDVVTDAGIRMNDGGCDPQGRFYCGTMAYDEEPGAGTLYRLDPDGSTHVVFDGVTISNGLQWSADGETAYYVDTPTNHIDVFDFDGKDASFHDRRTFAVVDPTDGHPDGLAVDADGGVWVALWNGGQVRRYDSAGALTAVVEVPGVSNTTAAAFGGTDLSTLYITTSRQGIADGAEPAAGAVFAVDPGIAGRPLPVFDG